MNLDYFSVGGTSRPHTEGEQTKRPGPATARRRPSDDTTLRVAWLRWLVSVYGPDAVGMWRGEAPMSFGVWKATFAS